MLAILLIPSLHIPARNETLLLHIVAKPSKPFVLDDASLLYSVINEGVLFLNFVVYSFKILWYFDCTFIPSFSFPSCCGVFDVEFVSCFGCSELLLFSFFGSSCIVSCDCCAVLDCLVLFLFSFIIVVSCGLEFKTLSSFCPWTLLCKLVFTFSINSFCAFSFNSLILFWLLTSR